MKSTIQIGLVIIAFTVFSLPTFSQSVTAEWQCKISKSSTKPTVTARIHHNAPGQIQANGIVKEAVYVQEGLYHNWLFDWNISKGIYDAKFVIDVRNTGKYFYYGDYSSNKLPVPPSFRTTCARTK